MDEEHEQEDDDTDPRQVCSALDAREELEKAAEAEQLRAARKRE